MSEKMKYRIVEKIDAGGMAIIYKAKAISIGGIEKDVAIKRILPSLCQKKRFVTMFLDEARLSMKLNHSNIVQVFDIGRAEGTYFIVMEYVDGFNLRRIFQKATEIGFKIPLKISLFIITEVLKALAHAHELKDEEGRPLGIVHRDVSPPNILISKSGDIKISDFGLAKAITQIELTDPGIIKGKFSYLAPEAIEGKPLDHRSDIFSSGVVLYELLTNRRLFLGKDDVETIELVQKAEIPSISMFNKEVNEELEKIVLKALAKDVKKRIRSSREFGDALSNFLFSHNLKVTSYDVAEMLKNIFERPLGEEIEDEQNAIRIEDLIQDEILNLSMIRYGISASPMEGSASLSEKDISLKIKGRIPTHEIWKTELSTGEREGTIPTISSVSLGDLLEGKETKPMEELKGLMKSGERIPLWKILLFILAILLSLGAGVVIYLTLYFQGGL